MREMPWFLLLGVVMAAMMALPALAVRLSYYDDSYFSDELGRSDETENPMYEGVNKRALIALSRFKPLASALSPDFHRYAARSYLSGRDGVRVAERAGRPPQNPMRFGR